MLGQATTTATATAPTGDFYAKGNNGKLNKVDRFTAKTQDEITAFIANDLKRHKENWGTVAPIKQEQRGNTLGAAAAELVGKQLDIKIKSLLQIVSRAYPREREGEKVVFLSYEVSNVEIANPLEPAKPFTGYRLPLSPAQLQILASSKSIEDEKLVGTVKDSGEYGYSITAIRYLHKGELIDLTILNENREEVMNPALLS